MIIKMRKKRKKHGLLILAVVFMLSAVGIRLLSASGAGKYIKEKIITIISDEEFVKYAMSGETQLVKSDKGKKLLRAFASQLPYTGERAENEAENEPEPVQEKKEQETEKESLTVWEYTPGGEKKENTYPIENITINPNSDKGYVHHGNIWVKNDSTKGIDLKWLLSAKLPFKLSGKGPHVLIVHTHGSESYLPQGRDTYTLTDVERTSDKKYNVIRVGDELETALKSAGISVVHDRNIYDSPSYNGSYTRTLESIGAHLKKNPSIKVVIDVHRDAMTASDGTKYRTVAEVNGQRVAQMMLVMSTGESGLPHPDWAENLKLAVKLQNAMASKYPGIMRPINLRKERFNMHATKGSMLVEVGTSANSLSEAIASVKLLGKELAGILKTAK
mgnify:CR=1 FL=1